MMTSIVVVVYLCAAAEPVAPQPPTNLLVEVDDAQLKDYRVLDVRPRTKYDAGHIPGAVHANVEPWSKAVVAGQADRAFWKAQLAQVGVSPRVPVVVYSDDVREAARAWWLLKFAGVPDVRLLNGGWKAYTQAQLPIQKEATTATAPPHDWQPDTARLAEKKHVLAEYKNGCVCVDARSVGEFRGEKALAQHGGRIPGAIHLEWSELLDPKTDKFLPQPKIQQLLKDRRIDLNKPQITYCQSGGRAAVVALALELAGAKNVRNYYRSWSEWGNSPDTPIDRDK
ncbi:MAG: rhodanese-like domain-containing protein [Gemmataceae bacterium]|nr:rhodanese-like domain-containing protein [Gemmata sp.]MDW8197787.1 rhodanese-like domain-containing protein [Gemmataceae bacterium]